MHFSENEYPLEDFGINLFEVVEGSEGIIEASPEKISCYLGLEGRKIHQFCSSILDRSGMK